MAGEQLLQNQQAPYFTVAEQASTPSTPPAGTALIYRKTDNLWYTLDDGGTETAIGTTADLTAHLTDTTDAHDASAISIADAGGYLTATDVEAALQEAMAEVDANTTAVATIVTDHGALTGLTDDDHTQYIKDAEFTGADTVLLGTGSGTFAELKHNFSAAVAPGSTDDSAAGYAVGSMWIDTTGDKVYINYDATATSALWQEVGAGGGGGGSITVQDESGTVSDSAVTVIKVPDGTLVDNGTGDVSIREVPAGVIGAIAYHNTTQGSLAAATDNALSLNSEDRDSDGFHDNVTNNSRMTIPAGMGGWYLLSGQTYLSGIGGSDVSIIFLKNGTKVRSCPDSNNAVASGSHVIYLAAGDYVEMGERHDSGTGTAGDAATEYLQTRFSVTRLGSGTVGEAIGAQAGRNSAVQSVGASYTKLTLDTDEWDTDGYFDDANDRMTIPTGLGGPHRITGTTHVASGASGTQYLVIYKNGAAWRRETSLATSGVWAFNFSMVDPDAVAGDYYELWAYASGGARNWGSSGYDPQETRLTIEKIATSGAQPGRVRTGTSFPTPGAAWTDRYVRTDLDGIEFTHDGTRWVSVQEYTFDFAMNNAATDPLPTAGSSNNYRAVVPTATASILVVAWDMLYRVATTNDGSNYWSVKLDAYDGSTADTLDTLTSSAGSAGSWTRVSGAVDTVIDATTEILLQSEESKVGSPGDLNVEFISARFRYVAT